MTHEELATRRIAEGEKDPGETGGRIMALAQEARKEVATRWDEATMERLKASGEKLVQEASAFEITDMPSFDAANEFFVRISQYKKEGGAFIEPLVEATRYPWAMTCDIRRSFYAPADEATQIFNRKIMDWKKAERQRAEAEQVWLTAERKAKEDAERKKLEERARIEKEKAEQLRKEAEARAAVEREKAEKARREKEAAEARAAAAVKAQREAEEKWLRAQEEKNAEAAEAATKEAIRLESVECAERERIAIAEREAFEAGQKAEREIARGEAAAAEREQKAEVHETRAESVFIPPAISTPTVRKTEITASGKAIERSTWEVTITDEMDLVKAVAAGPLNGGFPISVLNLDPERIKAALKRWAKMSLTNQVYEGNGVIIEASGKLSARKNSKSVDLKQ